MNVEAIRSFIPAIAKAITAIVIPILLVVAAWLAENVGIDVTFDNERVNEAIVTALTALAVWAVPNSPSAEDTTN